MGKQLMVQDRTNGKIDLAKGFGIDSSDVKRAIDNNFVQDAAKRTDYRKPAPKMTE